MKEATGEANMTVVTIALIAIVATVAVPIIRSMINSTAKGACCQSAGYTWSNGTCVGANESDYWDSTNKTCK